MRYWGELKRFFAFLPIAVFFLLSYFFVTVILELLGLIIKKPDF